MHKKSALMFFSSVGALALSFTSLLPVAVADTGSWTAYGSKNPITSSRSRWKCASTLSVGPNLLSQVCIIRSPSGTAIQGSVIVRNNNTSVYRTNANVAVRTLTGETFDVWSCPLANVKAKSWSVCFGKTFSYRGSAFAQGDANGRWLGNTVGF